MTRLNGVRVAICATDGFEAAELEEPQLALVRHEVTAVVAAPRRGEIQGMAGDVEFRRKVPVDVLIRDLDPDEFDGVVLPGGTVNADTLRTNTDLHRFLRAMDAAGKTIAAICHAPWELISAGLVPGRVLTSFPTLADDVRNAGGQWVDQAVVEDRNWITSRKPSDLAEFNHLLLIHLDARAYRRVG